MTAHYPADANVAALNRTGATTHDLGRKYGIGTQNIIHWRKLEQSAVLGKNGESKPEETVPLVEYKKAHDCCYGEFIEKLPHLIQWLSERRPPFMAPQTIAYGAAWVFQMCNTPAYFPESNGMAEAFV